MTSGINYIKDKFPAVTFKLIAGKEHKFDTTKVFVVLVCGAGIIRGIKTHSNRVVTNDSEIASILAALKRCPNDLAKLKIRDSHGRTKLECPQCGYTQDRFGNQVNGTNQVYDEENIL